MSTRILRLLALIVIAGVYSLPQSGCYRIPSLGGYADTAAIHDTVYADTNVNLKNGLVLYYPFTNSIADSSGNHHRASIFGNLSFTADKDGKANASASFDGSGTYIVLADSGSLSPPSFSIALEFYTNDTLIQELCSKIDFATSNSITWGVTLFNYNTYYPEYASFAVRSPDSSCGQFDPVTLSDLVYSMIAINTNQWYQLTCTFDNNGVEKIYLDGILRNAISRPFTAAKQCTEASLILGAWFQGAPLYFNGRLDEFRFYNRALNDDEVAELSKGF